MNIHKSFKDIRSVALLSAIEHNCNYNIIISNPVDGKFDPERSTYEFVRDSYFEKERPNAIILHKTDDLLKDEANLPEHIKPAVAIKRLSEMIRDEPKEKMLVITDPYAKLREEKGIPSTNVEQVIRMEPKTGRNDPCSCGSGKKFKYCCLK